VLEEVRHRAGVTDAEIVAIGGQDVALKGPSNWEWLQSIVEALDRRAPGASGTSIALFTRDVYVYLKNTVVRNHIEEGISTAVTPGVETVVVAHSLGTVIAYNLLRREGAARGWRVPLLVTVGSPLAVQLIRKLLRGFAAPTQCPECVDSWFNAFDTRDIVPLYPLDAHNFPLDPEQPAIENYGDVRNNTPNRHGISGYLPWPRH
jgi:pimeloyl-ACP methyl ester carboxylesterase